MALFGQEVIRTELRAQFAGTIDIVLAALQEEPVRCNKMQQNATSTTAQFVDRINRSMGTTSLKWPGSGWAVLEDKGGCHLDGFRGCSVLKLKTADSYFRHGLRVGSVEVYVASRN